MQFNIYYSNPNNSVSHLVFLRIVHWGGRHGHDYDGLYKQLNNDEESNGEKYESLTQQSLTNSWVPGIHLSNICVYFLTI